MKARRVYRRQAVSLPFVLVDANTPNAIAISKHVIRLPTLPRSELVIPRESIGALFLHHSHYKMFRQSVRRFATTAVRAAAEGSTAYATRVSTAQGVVNGLTEGISTSEITTEP
jgi:hypothetical protein